MGKIQNDESISAIAQRVFLIKKFKRLTWKQLGGEGVNTKLLSWKGKTAVPGGAVLDTSLSSLSRWMGVESILLRRGQSRTIRYVELLDQLQGIPLHERIIQLHHLKGISIYELAELANIEPATLWTLEKIIRHIRGVSARWSRKLQTLWKPIRSASSQAWNGPRFNRSDPKTERLYLLRLSSGLTLVSLAKRLLRAVYPQTPIQLTPRAQNLVRLLPEMGIGGVPCGRKIT